MNIYEKLLKIRKEVEYIQKTEKGNQGAMYVDPAVLLKTIRDKMGELSLLLIPNVSNGSSIECIDFPSSNNPNAKNFIFNSSMIYEWINCEKPEEKIQVEWYLTGKHMQDPAMAFGSALTYTERYFLLKFFQIPTAKDDPEFFEKKTKVKAPKKEITIGADNLKDLQSFCEKHDYKTTVKKKELLDHYKIDVYKTTIVDFNNIFEKIKTDHNEEI